MASATGPFRTQPCDGTGVQPCKKLVATTLPAEFRGLAETLIYWTWLRHHAEYASERSSWLISSATSCSLPTVWAISSCNSWR